MKRITSLMLILLIILPITIRSPIHFADHALKEKSNDVFVDPDIKRARGDIITAIALGLKEDRIDNITIVHRYKIIDGALIRGSKSEILKLASTGKVTALWNNSKVYALSSTEWNKRAKKLWQSFLSSAYSSNINATSADKVWNLGFLGENVVVAVLDTGIDKNHPDLDDLDDNDSTYDPKVIYEVSFVDYDFDNVPDEDPSDYFGHGTHVAGIIAGTGEASNGTYKGIAPKAKLMNVKVLDKSGSGYWDWVIRGIEFAAYGPDGEPNTGDEADVINLSLGATGIPGDPVSKAVETAWKLGVAVVVAAGNDGFYYTISTPGVSNYVITVGAADNYGNLASFSSRGPAIGLVGKPDILAPGVGIIAPRANNTNMGSPINDYYTQASGTSMATPHVAGAIALLMSAFPEITNNEVKVALLASARDVGYSSYEQGFGFLDIYSAFLLLNGSHSVINTQIETRKESFASIENNYLEARFFEQAISNYMLFKVTNKNNIYLERMAVRYSYNESVRFYWFTELNIIVPFIYSDGLWYLQLSTPDELVAVDVFILNMSAPWFYMLLKIIPTENVSWVSIYLGIDIDMMQNYADNNITYLPDMDLGYAFYSRNTSSYMGVLALNKTQSHHVGEFWTMWSAIADDSLNNANDSFGDISLAMKWNLTKMSMLGVAILFSTSIEEMLQFSSEAKNVTIFSKVRDFNSSFAMIKSISYKRPLKLGNNSVNITVANTGSTPLNEVKLGVYIDGYLITDRTFNISLGSMEVINTNVSLERPGIHFIRAVLYINSSIVDELVRPLIAIESLDVLITPLNPIDYPLQLRYIGQEVIYNMTVITLWDNVSVIASSELLNLSLSETINNSSQPVYSMKVRVEKAGASLLNISVIVNDSLKFEQILFLEIENKSVELFVGRTYIEETTWYRTADFDGVIESDEDVELKVEVKNNGNSSVYAYLAHSYFNDTNVYPRPLFGYVATISSYQTTNLTVSYYVYPDHTKGVVQSLEILYFSYSGAFPFHMGYPAKVIEFEVPITPRVNGTPEIVVDSVKLIDAGDGDGFFEPGEMIKVFFNASNIGNGSAIYVQVFGSQNVTGFVASAHLRTLPAMEPNTTYESHNPVYYWVSDDVKPGFVDGVLKIVYYDLAGKEYTTIYHFYFFCGVVANLALYTEFPSYVRPYIEYPLNITVFNMGENAADNVKVVIRIDGNILEEIELNVSAGESVSLNCSLIFTSEGMHSVVISLDAPSIYDEDPDDNSEEFTVIVDGSPPLLNILSPTNNTYLGSSLVAINIHAYDEISGIKNLTVILDGEEISHDFSSVINVTEGRHSLKVIVYDNCGNIAISKALFTVDLTPPRVNILLNNGTVVQEGSLVIRWDVWDNFGVDKVDIYIDGNLVFTFRDNQQAIELKLGIGEHFIAIYAYDLAGNLGVSWVYIRVATANVRESIPLLIWNSVIELILGIIIVLSLQVVIYISMRSLKHLRTRDVKVLSIKDKIKELAKPLKNVRW